MKISISEPFLSEYNKVKSLLLPRDVFLVGGFVRDTILGRKTSDMDFCVAMEGKELFSFFPKSCYFSKFMTVSFQENGIDITIASLRKESDYRDFRHPDKVECVSSLYEDFQRRDFTINALYCDSSFEVIDPSLQGLRDLKEKKIRFLGNPYVRIKEDPLRILRAYRFSFELGFSFDFDTGKAIQENLSLLSYLKRQKIREEISKCDEEFQSELEKILSASGIEIGG